MLNYVFLIFLVKVSLGGCCLHQWNTISLLLLWPVRLVKDTVIPEVTLKVSRKLISYFKVTTLRNKDWHMTLMAPPITQMVYGIPSESLFKFCFCIFFGKAPLVMTYHLHQWDAVRYLVQQPLVISQVSTKSNFPTAITNFIGQNSILV